MSRNNGKHNIKEDWKEIEIFLHTKTAVVKYYDSLRNSCAVRIIGFIAGLFTLIQAVQNSNDKPLSGFFTSSPFGKIDFTQLGINFELAKLILFFGGVKFFVDFFVC